MVGYMKNILFAMTVLLVSNYAAEAQSLRYKEYKNHIVFYDEQGNTALVYKKEAPANYVLAIRHTQMESVRSYPTLEVCQLAKKAAIKKDGKAWDCFPINHD